ncbi:MAG: ATP-binding cassette domain-containing protein [Anaerolineaceae bacterium]|nr:ATP-binding cassette domain-containing protein [Anaerolineaceae bacterium]
MAMISLQDVSLGFGGFDLLENVNLQIEKGDWIGLLGRNGMGKSTLLKLLHGDLSPQSGNVSRQQKLTTAYLPQEVPLDLNGSIQQIVEDGLPVQIAPLDDETAWKRQLKVDKILSRMQLDPTLDFTTLSAGMKRRVILARGLVNNPQLLLLDEPTNHLDVQTIQWLENFLAHWGGTLIFVTHDRVFLQKMANRIIELDRGKIYDWDCNYSTFLERKEAMLEAELTQQALFDKKLAQEETWIRQGIQARRTRNEGRVRALMRLRDIRAERREQSGKVNLQIQKERRSGSLVIEAQNIFYQYEQIPIVNDFSLTVQRGDKIGIVGPNGCGKTTLLRLLIGDLKPQSGSVQLGTNLEISYFDQLRSQLDEHKSVLDNVGEGRDTITVNGHDRNIISYLEDFLFSRERVHAPISALSGGERNRLLLARILAKPANLLVLDEPSNDLDIETLEILEDLLLAYSGTLLIVSHDRSFLNNLVTSIIVLDGKGNLTLFNGNYEDWLQTQATTQENSLSSKHEKSAPKEKKKQNDIPRPRKQSFKEKQELAAIPEQIESLEKEQADLNQAITDPAFYQQESETISTVVVRLSEIEALLAKAYQRWSELEE